MISVFAFSPAPTRARVCTFCYLENIQYFLCGPPVLSIFSQYSIQYLGPPINSMQYSTQYSTVSSTSKLGCQDVGPINCALHQSYKPSATPWGGNLTAPRSKLSRTHQHTGRPVDGTTSRLEWTDLPQAFCYHSEIQSLDDITHPPMFKLDRRSLTHRDLRDGMSTHTDRIHDPTDRAHGDKYILFFIKHET